MRQAGLFLRLTTIVKFCHPFRNPACRFETRVEIAARFFEIIYASFDGFNPL